MQFWWNFYYSLYWRKYKEMIRQHFSFLVDEYGFKEISIKNDVWGVRVEFCNLTTGIRAGYWVREGGFRVKLFRLVNGEIQDNPLEINDDSVLNKYDLSMLLSIRDPDFTKKAIQKHSEKLEDVDAIIEVATDLRNKAHDILSGDFTIFTEMEEMVKDNVRAYR